MASSRAGYAGGGAIYSLGIFGAFVYYFQQADTFWQYSLSSRVSSGQPGWSTKSSPPSGRNRPSARVSG